MSKISLFLSLIVLAGCSSSEDETLRVIKVRKVIRRPNSLEYSKIPFSKEELDVAKHLLKERGEVFYTDTSGQIFMKANAHFGESAKTYFWVLSDQVDDSLYKQIK